MQYLHTKETSDINVLCHYYTDENNNIQAICVDKDVSIEDAYTQMINYVEPIEIPLGLS